MPAHERAACIERKTSETSILLSLNLDGRGTADIHTGSGFFDHMLHHVARHGLFDLTIRCDGDTHIDHHHSVEDVSLCLGQALREALGDKRGIARYGHAVVPMDDALVEVAVDLSGRPHLACQLPFPTQAIGTFDCELVREAMQAIANAASLNLHVLGRAGINSHHLAEAAFKALGRALRAAVTIDPRAADQIPSTKGSL